MKLIISMIIVLFPPKKPNNPRLSNIGVPAYPSVSHGVISIKFDHVSSNPRLK